MASLSLSFFSSLKAKLLVKALVDAFGPPHGLSQIPLLSNNVGFLFLRIRTNNAGLIGPFVLSFSTVNSSWPKKKEIVNCSLQIFFFFPILPGFCTAQNIK